MKGLSKKETIVKILETERSPLTPKQITWHSKADSRFEALNHNTVKVYCRQLLHRMKIQQPLHGYYEVTKTMYGVGMTPVRVHDLRLVWRVGLFKSVYKFSDVVGGVKIECQYGSKRGKVSAMVACDKGFDFHTVCFAVDLIKRIAWEKAGVNLDAVPCEVCCELNEDYVGVRLDGIKCATVKSFLGDLERIYNKDDLLRSEVKIGKTDLASVYVMLKGGVTPYNILQTQYMILQEIKRVASALEAQNKLVKEAK